MLLVEVIRVSGQVWALTLLGISALIAVDFVTISRKPHEVMFREALWMSVFYVGISLAFGLALVILQDAATGAQFFTAYLLEKSLSVDNLFVFIVILTQFAVPLRLHQRILLFGITLALLLRGVFIAFGVAAISAFTFTFVLFGALLVWTGIQLGRHRNEDPDPMNGFLMRHITRRFPMDRNYDGVRLLVHRDGRVGPTALLMVLIAIATTDLLFALDSIPASFGVTQEAYIVFTANAFALLGLRALYFLLRGLLDKLVYLSVGLAAILTFIGVKMVLIYVHDVLPAVPEIPTGLSLVVIVAVLIVVTVASAIRVRRDPTAVAHAGRLTDPQTVDMDRNT